MGALNTYCTVIGVLYDVVMSWVVVLIIVCMWLFLFPVTSHKFFCVRCNIISLLAS